MSHLSSKSFFAFSGVIFQILFLLLRIIAVVNGDVDVDVFLTFNGVIFQILFFIRILFFLLRIIVVVNGDVDVDVLIVVFRSLQVSDSATLHFRAATEAAFEDVAKSWRLAAAEKTQAKTEEQNPCADSAKRGEIDAT